jgi:hypothetical protein
LIWKGSKPEVPDRAIDLDISSGSDVHLPRTVRSAG